MPEFVHLHTHSHYSLLDGAAPIPKLVKTCAEMNMRALALTDHGNMFGAIEFYDQALKAGIIPILGVEAYVSPGNSEDRTPHRSGEGNYHLVLLARNLTGYKNLLKLVSHGYLKGFYQRPRIDKQLLRLHHDGLIALSACIKGEVSRFLLQGMWEEARRAALEYKEIFGEDFYLEIQDHGLADEQVVREQMVRLSKELGIPVVATNDVHYLKREHYAAHDILLCLQTGADLNAPDRLRYATDQIYFKSAEEMAALFQDVPEAIENTVAIAEKCHVLLDLKARHLPRFALPAGERVSTLDEYLEKLVWEGVRRCYGTPTPEIENRVRHELKIIRDAGYAGYFLIVRDFIEYARSVGIPVGPGRGSAAGSVVSYLLGITRIDPLKYDLVFERFLNPERLSPPDIDVDFCDQRRDEVIAYVRKKYGANNVAQIITFGSMAARAVVRDVGRVMKIPLGEVDRIAKLIPAGPNVSLQQALNSVKELADLVASKEEYQKLIEYSLVLEGIARHASTHAAGVVIAPDELTNYVPLYRVRDQEVVTQYDKDSLEKIGLLKIDLLGLRTLTVVDDTVKAVRRKGVPLNIDAIPLDDAETYRLLSEGRTVGVFQFESSGMREWLKRLRPTRLEDLIAMNALYRPGPMDTIEDFVARRHGQRTIEYLHPLLEPILKETYGVAIYQEQVIRICHEIGGFSLGQADVVRRAMGKKIPEEMERQRGLFVNGARERGIDAETASAIFDMMVSFAGYGFNKSHAAGYALLAYQTAYLKAHYPAEFMAATLTSEMGDTDRVVKLIGECRRMNIPVLPPDVNESEAAFVVTEKGIRFGLGAVKNAGLGAIEEIVRARHAGGAFTDLFDFCARVDLRVVNKKVLESLIQAGAMDSLGGHRAQLMAALEAAVNWGQALQAERAIGQTSIFGDVGAEHPLKPSLPQETPWSEDETLRKEKAVLGFYVSGHPLNRFREEIETFATLTLDGFEDAQDGTEVRVCGVVTDFVTRPDQRGGVTGFFTLEDLTGTGECLMFSSNFEKYREYLYAGAMVMVVGRVSNRLDKGAKIICEEVVPLTEVAERFARRLCLRIAPGSLEMSTVERLGELLAQHKGDCPLFITLPTQNGRNLVLSASRAKVKPGPGLMEGLRALLGSDNVWMAG
ncbi:MAG: DNA polymerase III subunit alpha [candidate division KSB1 bacterium]|nr:DNA polymerase III subunit alpha [candidate division KSB1 bacterium]